MGRTPCGSIPRQSARRWSGGAGERALGASLRQAAGGRENVRLAEAVALLDNHQFIPRAKVELHLGLAVLTYQATMLK